MTTAPKTHHVPFLFHVSRELLEIDVLDLDASLHAALPDVADGQLIRLQIGPTDDPSAPSRRLPNGRSKATGKPRSGTSLLCTVDRSQGVITAPGLGQQLRRLLGDNGGMLVIERVEADPPEGAKPDDAARPASSASPELAGYFAVYSPRRLFFPVDAPEGADPDPDIALPTATGALSEPESMSPTPIRFHHDPAMTLLQQLAVLPAVSAKAVDLHNLGLQLSLRRGFDTLLSLRTLRNLSPFPHQIRTVERALRQMRGRALLCDEVGLGKTIEAGLILNEYMIRRLVRTALILTPSSLVEQWREELIRKFDLPFISHDSTEFKSTANAWATHPYIVASLDTAKREPHREQILQHAYDLVIVDEAHHLKNRNTLAWKFVNQLNKKYILLLTATPVENSMEELFNLITLLKPGQLRTAAEYKRKFVSRRDPLQPQNVEELKRLLQSVMIRNRRSATGVIECGRTAETTIIAPGVAEQQFYAGLSVFVKRQLAPVSPQTRSWHPLVMKNLLRQAGSSAACTIPTLRKLATERDGADEVAKTELSELLDLADASQTSAKMRHLAQFLARNEEQTVVFTGFVETQKAVAGFLRDCGIDVTEFHGGMTRAEKELSIERFRAGTPVLVSTESGGEGRNLQFCHRLVNFDIPWNPMRIEQRIGRIHRIGQNHDVNVTNLVSAGTLEQHIVHILDVKINMFQLVVGELDMILGALDEQRDFEDLVLDVWLESQDDSQVVEGMERLGEALALAKQHYQKVQDIDRKLLTELAENE